MTAKRPNSKSELLRFIAFSTTLILLLVVEQRTETILSDVRLGGVVRRAIVIPEREFDINNVQGLARRFLEQSRGRYHLLLFYIFTKEENAGHHLSGMVSDVPYEGWLQMYRQFGQHRFPVAEILAYGGSATMRVRDPHGELKQVVLEGTRDTFRFKIRDFDFEIVRIDTPLIPDVHKDGPHEPINATFNIRTSDPLEEETGLAALEFLSKELNSPRDLHVVMRNDIWFIEDSYTSNLFFESDPPPPAEQYYKSITLSCALWGGKQSCLKHGGFAVTPKKR